MGKKRQVPACKLNFILREELRLLSLKTILEGLYKLCMCGNGLSHAPVKGTEFWVGSEIRYRELNIFLR